MASVEVSGLNEYLRFLKKYPLHTLKEADNVLKKYAPKIEVFAKSNHMFGAKTGNAERSIESVLNLIDHSLKFWINPDYVTNNGFNYAWGQNDGTRSKYRRGKISPPAFSKGGIGGITHDDYMGRTWEKFYPEIVREMNAIPNKIERTLK